jgi:1-acyl-sn-glycerol-3-phosphate acyltransferase
MTQHQINVRRHLRNFYHQAYELLGQGDTVAIRRLYENTCVDLENFTPVNRYYSRNFTSENLKSHPRIVVAANHITTPNLFQIADRRFHSKIGIRTKELLYQRIQPFIVRHYPLVNMLRENGYFTYVLSGKSADTLMNIGSAWGSVHIGGETGTNRLQQVFDAVKLFPQRKWALIIFPEGEDTYGNIFNHEYILSRFKSGFAAVAENFKIPVLPVSLSYYFDPMHYGMFTHDLERVDGVADIKKQTKKIQKIVQKGIDQTIRQELKKTKLREESLPQLEKTRKTKIWLPEQITL